MARYTKKGPYVDNSAPGIDHNAMTDLDNYMYNVGDTNFSCDGNGALTVVKIVLSVGSIARIARNLAVACINGKTTVTHGLGATPDVVLITINASGIPTSGLVAGYNPGTLSSTQVDIWANGNFNVDVTTIKF